MDLCFRHRPRAQALQEGTPTWRSPVREPLLGGAAVCIGLGITPASSPEEELEPHTPLICRVLLPKWFI